MTGKLYAFYHELATCYKWKYKRLRWVKLALDIIGIGLTVVGGVAGGVTANPVVLGAVAGPWVLIQGYIAKSGLTSRVEYCRLAHVSYQKVLTRVRSYMRGAEYDEVVFLSDIRVLDDMVTEVCPLHDSMARRYKKVYGN